MPRSDRVIRIHLRSKVWTGLGEKRNLDVVQCRLTLINAFISKGFSPYIRLMCHGNGSSRLDFS